MKIRSRSIVASKAWQLAGAFALTCAVAQIANAAPSGVVYYKFDEGSGTIANDSSGNGNDGTLTGAITGGGVFGVAGVKGTALQLSGSSNWAQFTAPVGFDPSASGTFSFWVNPTFTGRQAFLGVESNSMKAEISSAANMNTRPSGATDETLQVNSPGTYVAGTWMNIQITWQHTGGTTIGVNNVYINGTEVTYNGSSTSAITGWTPQSLVGLDFSLGRRHDANDRHLNGTLDDVAFYNTVLSAAQLELIRTATNGAAAYTTNQIAYWNLDDTAGTTTAPTDGGLAIDLLVGAANPPGVVFVNNGGPLLGGTLQLDAVNWTGTGSSGDFIDIPDSASLDAWDKSFGTVVMWVNPDVVQRMGLLRDTAGGIEIQTASTGRVFLETSSANNTLQAENNTFAASTWQHLAFVWNETTQSMGIYLNGTLRSNTISPGAWATVDNAGNWELGRDFGVSTRYYQGLMADFAIIDTDLTVDDLNFIINFGVNAFLFPEPAEEPAVPEPATLSLLALAAAGVLRRPGRRVA